MITNADTIKEAARIEDIVSDFVTLKRKGINLMACCPFHGEKTPSFAVNPARGIFKCFGCGKGGDAITFLRENGMEYPDALRHIAKKYGIQVEESANGKPDPEHDKRTQLRTTATVVQAHFSMSQADETPGRRYWLERGFKEETLDEFGIGWCDGSKPAHIADAELSAIGAINEKGNVIFYKRSTIPIHDRRGNVVAWAGRTVEGGKDTAKYINSPETPIYSKAKTLFNLHRAASHIRTAQEVWIVEGYADAMALWQVGVKNCVALCGTALSDEQAAELKKFNGERPLRFILCLDNETRKGDDNYKEAVARAYHAALAKLIPIGEVRRVEYPKACKDMADVVHRGIDPAAIEKTDALLAFVADAKKDLENASPVQMAEFQETVAKMISEIPKENVRSIYIKQLSTPLDINPRDLDRKVKDFRTESETEEKNRVASEYRYIKVGDTFYQRGIEHDIVKKTNTIIYKRRLRTELVSEGISVSRIERFFDWICEPSHTNYRRIIEIEHDGEQIRFFNSYHPLPYKPKEFQLADGFYKDLHETSRRISEFVQKKENLPFSFFEHKRCFDYETIPEIQHIARFMKHIFNYETYGNKYLQIGWDWLTLCYLNPMQRLQAIALVSSEEGTGKSTFINLLAAIFGQNSILTEASRINATFNAMTSGKVLQMVEETKDEKGQVENKLKQSITGYTQIVEPKYEDSKSVVSFSKFVFASNHESDFMKVGTETTRFFVMKVNPIKNKIVDFEEKMFLEIPYLLYFLQKRGVLHPSEDRLHFNPKLLENEALLKLRHASKDQVVQVMEELFQNIFLRCELTEPILHISSLYLKLLMCAYGGKSYEQKTTVYFQNAATKDMRLPYRDNPTKRKTIELAGIHADSWINQETWLYEEKRVQARFIEFPIWKFCTPADVRNNHAHAKIAELIENMEKEELTGEAAEWLQTLKTITTPNPEGEDIPF